MGQGVHMARVLDQPSQHWAAILDLDLAIDSQVFTETSGNALHLLRRPLDFSVALALSLSGSSRGLPPHAIPHLPFGPRMRRGGGGGRLDHS